MDLTLGSINTFLDRPAGFTSISIDTRELLKSGVVFYQWRVTSDIGLPVVFDIQGDTYATH
jgi:hypothetical protein